MKMIIGGKHVEAADKKTFDVIAPATMKKIDTVPAATKADVDGAIENARKGAKEWADVPMYQRIEAVYRFADLLEQPEHFKILVELEIEENGKPISMAEEDIHVSAYICRAFAEKARNFSGDIIPAASEPGTR